MSTENKGLESVLYEITDLQQRERLRLKSLPAHGSAQMNKTKKVNNVPESVEDDRALIKLIPTIQQLAGHDGGVAEGGRLAADLLTVQNDVLSVSSDQEQSA